MGGQLKNNFECRTCGQGLFLLFNCHQNVFIKFYVSVLLGSCYTYWSYYTYCSDFCWIVLFIFVTALYSSYYTHCLKKKWTELLIFITALLFLLYVLFRKKQACNIYKYCSYNRNPRVLL